jgi:hypothetical protein
MNEPALTIPRLLEEMISAGRWPTIGYAQGQASREAVQRLAPEETEVFFYSPPFQTVRELSSENGFWNWPESDPSGIDFDLAILIGDFGPGTDAPIVLDYRVDAMSPRVLRLRWRDGGEPNRWVVVTDDFQSFVDTLRL